MDESQTTVLVEGLIVRLHRGDVEASEQLIACAQDRLTRLAHKMLGGFPDVKRWEGTDDVFTASALRLHRALRDKPPSSALHFFRLAAMQIRRELNDLARHYRSRPELAPFPTPPGSGESDCSPGFNPPDRTSRDPHQLETWTLLHEVVERLPEQLREVFDLLWYQGLTQAEVADLLAVSLKTVKNRWMAARLRLCEALDGEMPE
jgi:RNA polymerase sigma-70 factor (ECF subfamily)